MENIQCKRANVYAQKHRYISYEPVNEEKCPSKLEANKPCRDSHNSYKLEKWQLKDVQTYKLPTNLSLLYFIV